MGRRGAWLLLAGAALCLVAGGLYGIDSPFVYGHYGYHGGAYATRARHTIRHGSILPANVPRSGPPRPEDYYLHHPILTHQIVTLTLVLLGDHEYSVRAAGLLACTACFLLLALLVWAQWGPWQAVLACATFVIVPINVWFANLVDAGYPSIASLLAFFLCYLRWLETHRWRDGVWASLFAALAGGFEWSPYLAAVPVFLHALWAGLRSRGRSLGFFTLYAAAVALPFLAHALVSWKTGHLGEMRESYAVRTSGSLDHAFYLRTYERADAMFGGPLLFVSGLWFLLLVWRALRGRWRSRDLVSVSFAFALLAYIHIFRAGVLIHPYRYLYGGIICAVATADLVDALSSTLRHRAAWVRRIAAAAVTLVVFGATLPLAARALDESRRTGGVPLSGPYDPGTKKIAFAEVVRELSRPDDVLYVHTTFEDRHWGLRYYLDRDTVVVPSLRILEDLSAPERSRALLICIPDALSGEESRWLGHLAGGHPVREVSGFLLVDLRREGSRMLVEDAVPPRSRSLVRRYFEGPYPRLERVWDPSGEVALREKLGLT